MQISSSKFNKWAWSSLFYLGATSSAFSLTLLSSEDGALTVGAKDGFIVSFGNYYQDKKDATATTLPNKYKFQPIAWRILDSENLDPKTNLILEKTNKIQPGFTLYAQRILDNTLSFGAYIADDVTRLDRGSDWRESDIRKFLNDQYSFTPSSDDEDNLLFTSRAAGSSEKLMKFYQPYTDEETSVGGKAAGKKNTFTTSERAIITQPTITSLDIWDVINGGSSSKGASFAHFTSKDYVFLLGYDEVASDIPNNESAVYGFVDAAVVDAKITKKMQLRNAQVTYFANTENGEVWNVFDENSGHFWLRSPGGKPGSAAFVNADGNVNDDGGEVGGSDLGVRPALLSNLAPVIFLQDDAQLPFSFLSERNWQAILNFTSSLAMNFYLGSALDTFPATQGAGSPEIPETGYPSWVGAFSTRTDCSSSDQDDNGYCAAYHDDGVNHLKKFILKVADDDTANALGEVSYSISKVTSSRIEISANTRQNGGAYFDAALIKNPATSRRSGYNYNYAYTPKVARLAKVTRSGTFDLSIDFPSSVGADKILIFQHKATVLDDKFLVNGEVSAANTAIQAAANDIRWSGTDTTSPAAKRITSIQAAANAAINFITKKNWTGEGFDENTIYQTEYGNAVLTFDLKAQPPALLEADADIVIKTGAEIGLSEDITEYTGTLSLDGGTLHLNGPVDFSKTSVSLTSGTLNISKLRAGQKIIFPSGTKAPSSFRVYPPDNWESVIKNLDWTSDDGDADAATVKALSTAPRNYLASSISINDAADAAISSFSNQLSAAATAGASSMFNTSIGASKVKTGSHIKSFGGSLALGVSKSYEDIAVGVYLEGGLSHFDSYTTEKAGSGNSQFAGAGFIIKTEYQPVYFMAGAHGGFLKTKASFKANTSYVGALAELGVHLARNLDSYARFNFSRTSDIEETINNLTLQLDATNSYRARFGMRLHSVAEEDIKPYLGLAYEYEFRGKTDGVIIGFDKLASPSMKGGSGIVELGMAVNFSKHALGHINLESFFGRRQGFSGGLGLEFRF